MYKKWKTKTKSGSTVTPHACETAARYLKKNLNSDSCHQPRSPPPISNPATLIQDGDASSRPHARMACSKLFTTITIDYCKQKQCDPKLAKQTNKNSQQIVKPLKYNLRRTHTGDTPELPQPRERDGEKIVK